MNIPTPVIFDNKAREKILRGINVIYEAVRRTMGPQGGNALIYGLYSRPYRVTNDGNTIANIIELKNEHENLAANALQDAANRTNQLAGDGTSATCVIAGKLINTIFPRLDNSTENFDVLGTKTKKQGVMDIKRALFKTRDEVIEKLKQASKPCTTKEELKKIAVVSVENEEYGNTIADMSWEIGTDGYIDILEGFKGTIQTEVIHGARFPAKIPAKIFVNKPERYELEIEDASVLLTNYVIDNATWSEVVRGLGSLPEKQKPTKLIIFAPDFKTSVLEGMAKMNIKAMTLIYAPIKVPSLRTVQFEDVEIFTGAKFINKERGDKLSDITTNDLGFLKKLVVKDTDIREDCVALGGRGVESILPDAVESPVQNRIRILKEQMETNRENGQKELLRRRIAGLSSAVGIIRVSCDSEAETYYWKKKIEDGVYACKAALEEGYVKGGGLALKEIAETLPDDDLLKPALLACYEQIQENAEGVDITEDIIDPTKAIRCAVEHAVSVAANLATVKIIIPEEKEVSPAEGYKAIAAAIYKYAYWQAKEKAIIEENEREIEKDEMASHDAILRNVIE